jgi:hypothetical protein
MIVVIIATVIAFLAIGWCVYIERSVPPGSEPQQIRDVRDTQRRAERQIFDLTLAAFDDLLAEGRRPGAK